jgi:two-component system sensor histidine kinase UhpB
MYCSHFRKYDFTLRFLFFWLIGFHSPILFAQEQQLLVAKELVDQLKYNDAEKELEAFYSNSDYTKSKKSLVKAHELMTEIYFQTGRMNLMHDYNTKLLQTASELKDTTSIIQAYNRFGIYEMNSGNFKESENYFQKALSMGLEKKNNLKTAEIYSNIASNHLTASNHTEAIEWFFKSLKLREKLGDHKGLGETYSNIASVYYLTGKTDDAIRYQNESIKIRENIKDTSGLVITHMNIGQLYILKNHMENALFHLQKSVGYAESTQNSRLLGSSYSGMAAYYNKMGNYSEALNFYSKAISIFEKSDNKPLLSRLYVAAANAAKEVKDTTSASAYYRKALDYSMQLKNKENISNAYEKLSVYYQEQNQPDLALKYYKNYVSYRDSISSTSNSAKIEEIRTQYETEKKDNEILRLQTGQRIKDLQIEKQNAMIAGNLAEAKRIQNEIDLLAQTQALNDLKIKQQQEDLEKQTLISKTKEQELLLAQQQQEINDRKLMEQHQFRNFLMGGILVLLILGGILFNRYKLQKKLEQQEALLAVRNHIARDLHDKVGSTLTGIKILSEVSAKTMNQNSDKTLSFIQQITEQTKSIQQEMSDIVWAINPNNDKIENLVVRMREYVAQTLEPKNVEIHMNVDKNVLDYNLNMNSRKEFFLIFREAINNIAKHSEAQKVEILVEKNAGNIKMLIRDDGKGMDVNKETSSNGLKNMKERSQLLNGHLTFQSEEQNGTSMELEFPAT